MPVFAFAVGSLGDIIATIGLVVQVTQALYDSSDSSGKYRELMHELRSLHRALILIKDAIQHCDHTPLGAGMANTVRAEVDECHFVMRTFLDNIDGYRKPLTDSTGIGGLWGKVWWALWKADELAVLRKTLRTRSQTLTMLLTALTSFALTDLGNEMRAGRTSLNEITAIVRRTSKPNPLCHNPENIVWVVDIEHLTRKLETDPSNALDWYQLGRTYMVGRNYLRAYEAYQQSAYRDGRNPTLWSSIGDLYHHVHQFRDALDAYSRGVRIDPYISELWADIGRLYMDASNQIHDAIDAYARAGELDPSNLVIAQRLNLLIRARSERSDNCAVVTSVDTEVGSEDVGSDEGEEGSSEDEARRTGSRVNEDGSADEHAHFPLLEDAVLPDSPKRITGFLPPIGSLS